jgi:hypothetical protein
MAMQVEEHRIFRRRFPELEGRAYPEESMGLPSVMSP